MFIEGIILLVGLIILIKSSEMSILYSIRLAKLLEVTQMAIGFLFISIITSLPEFSIAILSSLKGEGLLSVGNLFGANIINMTLIFGIMAILVTIKTSKEDYKQLIRTIAIISAVSLAFVFLNEIGFLFGLFCITTFVLFFYSIYKNSYKLKPKKIKYEGLKTVETVKTFAYAVASIILVIISAKFVTDSAIQIASLFGIAESLIGASILAIGTTLPELSISLIAIKRKNISLAIGDLIGSLVTNLTLILGSAAIIAPIVIGPVSKFLAIFLLFTSMIFLFLTSATTYGKKQGIILIILFFGYIIALLNYQIFFI
ncbi:MAG: hypothetical protein KJ906_00145 [Nanoarchaeota archaeon]|nr:hypothetical protein [Nanoarchaeota archaeon]